MGDILMRFSIALFILSACAFGQATPSGGASGATDPATCTPGTTLDNWRTDLSAWHYCSATNTWSAGRSVAGSLAVGGTVLPLWYDVRSYGAKGDGSTDDYTAITNASDCGLRDRRHVIFPWHDQRRPR